MITVLCNYLQKYSTTLTLSMNNVCAFKKILENVAKYLGTVEYSLINERLVRKRYESGWYKRPKEKIQKDKQLSTKHTYKTKDRETLTSLKTGAELRCSGRINSSCSARGTRRVIIYFQYGINI